LLLLLPAAPAAAAPAPSGTLLVTGTLQDGATLTAKGVSWTPAPCGGGSCSKVLTVSYRWQACANFCSATYGGFGFAAWRADLDLDGKTFFPCWT
jgi:hypothetical protein